MRNRLRCVLILAAALALVTAATPAPAQTQAATWPQRPVRFLVTLGPGSGIDIGTRLLADRLSARWGQPVVVENRPGGDGLVAIGAMIAAHDDHVLLASPTSSFTAHPFVYKNVPYKPEDLQPIARVSNTIIVMAVPADLPVRSLGEFVALARAQPGKLIGLAPPAPSTSSLQGSCARPTSTCRRCLIAIRSKPPPISAPVAFSSTKPLMRSWHAALQAGKVKLLAVTNSVRAPVLPDVPTVTEAGYPDLALDGLVGFFGPPEMPLALRERIAADVKEVGADPAITTRLSDTGQLPNFSGPAEFHAAIELQRARVAAAAKEIGAVPTE